MKDNLVNLLSKSVLFIVISIGMHSSLAFADGMVDDSAPRKKVAKPAAPVYQAPAQKQPEPAIEHKQPVTSYVEDCEWKFRLSPGMTVWFFDEENNLPGPALYMDIWRTDYPINFHMGVEGRHMYLGQEEAEFAMEWEDKTTRVTYLRIPFALEYMNEIDDDTTWFIGAGPDIIHTANDISETNVGVHASTRVHYAFNEHWGVAVEAGYMWGHLDNDGPNVSLDNAFITPTLAYTF